MLSFTEFNDRSDRSSEQDQTARQILLYTLQIKDMEERTRGGGGKESAPRDNIAICQLSCVSRQTKQKILRGKWNIEVTSRRSFFH